MTPQGTLRLVGWAVLFAAILMVSSTTSLHAGDFSVSGGFQTWNGNYTYQTSTTTFAFTGGVRYHTEMYSVSATVPLLFQNSSLVTQVGGMYLPKDGGGAQMSGQGPHHGGAMMTPLATASSSSFESGVGDMLLMGNVRVVEESAVLPSLAVTGQVKVPWTGTATDFSTGKWDYGAGIALRKEFGSFGAFADLGKLVIGDPDSVHYHDPVSFGFGVGEIFAGGTFSAMLYYQAYSLILDDYEPPRQLSVGLLYQSSPSTVLSLMSCFGMSNAVSDIGIAIGVEVKI